MKNLAIAASVGTILIGAYSFVYACNDSQSNQAAKTAKASKAVEWYAVASTEGAPAAETVISEKTVVCKTVESVAPIAIELEVPNEAFQMARVIHIRGAAVKHTETDTTPVGTVIRTAKVAATLGRAFVTTVGAVFGSLVDAAVQATASLV